MIFGLRGIFTFANFSMLNNYFPKRFHFFDFSMSIMSISMKITTFLRFLVFLYGMSSPLTEKEHFWKNAPERQNARCTWETLDVHAKSGPHIGPHVHCVHFLMSGASSYPTLTTELFIFINSLCKCVCIWRTFNI